MRSARTEAELIEAWVKEVLPAIQGSYPYGTDQKPEALPDVQIELLDRRVTINDPLFPFDQLQQSWIHIMQFQVTFMVNNEDPSLADSQLKSFSDDLFAAAFNDGTLGQRVEMISPFVDFNFASPFVEYPSDGTKGREMVMTLATGERLEGPQ